MYSISTERQTNCFVGTHVENNGRGCSRGCNGVPKQDHIVPRIAVRQHKAVLGTIGEEKNNLMDLCSSHHDAIDGIKIPIFRTRGVSGLVTFIGVYPRAEADENFELQRRQFLALFKSIYDNIQSLKRPAPPYRIGDYSKSIDVLERYIDKWEAGKFHITRFDVALLVRNCYNCPHQTSIAYRFPDYLSGGEVKGRL